MQSQSEERSSVDRENDSKVAFVDQMQAPVDKSIDQASQRIIAQYLREEIQA
jgi:hypothetical protein